MFSGTPDIDGRDGDVGPEGDIGDKVRTGNESRHIECLNSGRFKKINAITGQAWSHRTARPQWAQRLRRRGQARTQGRTGTHRTAGCAGLWYTHMKP